MRKEQIIVGKSYVNEEAGIIREVVEEIDERNVRANAFELSTGKLVPTRHSTWNRRELARWAQRETTAGEVRRIHPYEPTAWFDVPFPSDHGGTPLEQAKTTLEGTPGYHPPQQAR
ncbi:MAG TPA: hypothetical protein VMJ64_01360 [Anaerolineales bacterium]|nr:hypothetical protein [Anaerolineales bacterium]